MQAGASKREEVFGCCKRPISEIAGDNRDAILGAGMVYDSPRELGIGQAEFHRIQATARRKLPCNPQRAVSNIRAKLVRPTRLHPLDDVVEELALLVSEGV